MNDVVTLLLAGGMGSRLSVLAQTRAKPAVPFAGSYRIIDFTLSNCVSAGLGRVGVLTQYRPRSLNHHLGSGMAWDLWGKTKVLRVLPPFMGHNDADWYRGTADAVYQNLDFVRRYDASQALILSGDHVYRMNYDDMLHFHMDKGADVTIAAMTVPWEEASRFGLLMTDPDHRVVEFEEKPAKPRSNLASMGVYVFRRKVLEEALEANCPNGRFDFGNDVIPWVFEHGGRIFAYPFRGYWRDVGTLQSYWEANMDALRGAGRCGADEGIDLGAWGVRTNAEADGTSERPPAWIGPSARVSQSLVSRGAVVEGTVERSVLSPGVHVAAGAVVRDSIVMHGTVVAPDATLDRAIVDKRVRVGAGARVGVGPLDGPPNRHFPDHLDTGLTVLGRAAVLPDGVRVGRNCLVFPGVTADRFTEPQLASGDSLSAT